MLDELEFADSWDAETESKVAFSRFVLFVDVALAVALRALLPVFPVLGFGGAWLGCMADVVMLLLTRQQNPQIIQVPE